MEKHWSQFCELTAVLSSLSVGDNDNKQFLDLLYKVAEEDFFDGVEISACDDEIALNEIKPILKAGHLSLDIFAQPQQYSAKINLDNKDKEVREKALSRLESLMKQVYILEPRSLIFPYSLETGAKIDETTLQILKSSIHQLCEFGEKLDLCLVMKIIDANKTEEAVNLSYKHYSEVARDILTNHTNFCLLYDFYSPFAFINHCERISLLKDYIKYVHVGRMDRGDEARIYGDFHEDSCFAGSVTELAKMIKAMLDDGLISDKSETKPVIGLSIQPYRPDSLLNLVLANDKRSWRQAWFEAG